MLSSQILILVPCYNEEERLPVNEYLSFLSKSPTLSICFINDGSNDGTSVVLNNIKTNAQNAHVLELNINVGKANAIREGMLKFSKGNWDYIGFLDADLATPLEELENLIKHTKNSPQPYLVMGSRVKLLGSTSIKRKLRRHYIGRIFATIVSNMLKLPIYDTQCGAKLVKHEMVSQIFEKPFISKWLFDVEMLFRLKQQVSNLENKVIEVSLKKWEDKDGSKISAAYFLKAPFDLLKIYFHYR